MYLLFPVFLILLQLLMLMLHGRIGNQLAVIVDAAPLGQSVVDVDHAAGVEHVATARPHRKLANCNQLGPVEPTLRTGNGGRGKHKHPYLPGTKVLFILIVLEVDQGREEEDHIAPFIHDRRAAVRAADFAGKLVDTRLLGGLVPAQVVVPVGEIYVRFVEDGTPLEGGAWTKRRGERVSEPLHGLGFGRKGGSGREVKVADNIVNERMGMICSFNGDGFIP